MINRQWAGVQKMGCINTKGWYFFRIFAGSFAFCFLLLHSIHIVGYADLFTTGFALEDLKILLVRPLNLHFACESLIG